MKKLLSLLLSLMFVISLSACGADSTAADGANPPADATETAPADTVASRPRPLSQDGTWVACFSWSGNTEQVAQTIAAQTGGVLFAIRTASPDTEDCDELLNIAQQE